MQEHEEKKICVTYYFVSGKSTKVNYDKEKWEKVYETLSKQWNLCYTTGFSYGINFSLVTHYEIEE